MYLLHTHLHLLQRTEVMPSKDKKKVCLANIIFVWSKINTFLYTWIKNIHCVHHTSEKIYLVCQPGNRHIQFNV